MLPLLVDMMIVSQIEGERAKSEAIVNDLSSIVLGVVMLIKILKITVGCLQSAGTERKLA